MAVLGGFSLEKALLLFGLIWFHLLQPGEGKLKWWRVRYWDGKYWYVWADGGFWEPLTDSEYLSLRKAMRKDATIGDYIHDESKTGCWDVSDWRPIWDKYLEAWRIPVDYDEAEFFWDADSLFSGDDQPGEGSWSSSSHHQPGEGSWSSSSHYQPGQGSWSSSHYQPGEGSHWSRRRECYQPGEGKKEREEEWDEEQWRDWEDNLPPPRRYLFRSRQSDLNRLERRDLKRRGLEVPPHLRPKPVTQIESQELKRELRELYKRAKEMQQSMQPGEGMCAKGKGKSRGYMWETERPEPRSPSKPRRRSKSRPKPGEGTCKEEPEKKEPEEGKQKKKKKHKHRSRHHSKGLKSVPETEEEVEGAGGSKGSQDKPGEGKETKEEEEECAEPPPEEHPPQQPGEGLLVSEAQENTMLAEEVDYTPDDQPGEGQACPGPSTQEISMDVDEGAGQPKAKPGEGKPEVDF